MRPLAILVILASSVASAFGQGFASDKSDNKPAAVVNGQAIPVAEVQELLQQRPSPVPLSNAQKLEMRKAAIEVLIDDLLMRQFLQTNAPTVTKAELQAEMIKLQETLKAKKIAWQEFLQKGGQTEANLTRDMAAQIQWRKYLAKRVPDTLAKRYYDENKVFFDKVYVRAQHILVKVEPKSGPTNRQLARTKLAAIRQEIMAGKIGFADAAKKYSDCPSKAKGGDLGHFPFKFAVVEPFAQAAFSTKIGGITDIVETEFGMHIIKVNERTKGEPSDFQKIKEAVRQVYAQEINLYQNIITETRKKARIEVYMK